MHLGLIGGIGPASTELYYREIVSAHKSAGKRLELTIAQADSGELIANVAADARQAQVQTYLRLTSGLKAAGADIVAITSVAGHFCAAEFIPVSPLPVVHIVSSVREQLARRGLHRVGLMGTKIAMSTGVYGALDGLEVLTPEGDERESVHREYLSVATLMKATEEQRQLFFAAGRRLMERGAEAVILGATDFFLAFDGHDCGFPALDCAKIHAGALAAMSLAAAAYGKTTDVAG